MNNNKIGLTYNEIKGIEDEVLGAINKNTSTQVYYKLLKASIKDAIDEKIRGERG